MAIGLRKIGGYSGLFQIPERLRESVIEKNKPNLWNRPKGSSGINQLNAEQEQSEVKFKPRLLSESPQVVKTEQTIIGPKLDSGDAQPIVEPLVTNKPSLFGAPQRPEQRKTKWYDYLLGIGVPALLSGLSGGGAVQGALSGVAGMLEGRQQREAEGQRQFEVDREYTRRKQESEEKAESSLFKQLQDVDYKNKYLDVLRSNAATGRMRALKPDSTGIQKPTQLEKIAKIKSRVDSQISSGQIPSDEDLALLELYGTQEGVDLLPSVKKEPFSLNKFFGAD